MIKIQLLSKENFDESALDTYDRKQEVNKVYRKQNGEYVLVDCPYTEDWDIEKKRQVAKDISSDAYISFMALDGKNIVGFIGLLKKLTHKYMILDLIQVANSYRGNGIGRALFNLGKETALKAGAKALYISACSSEETIAFYRAMGAQITDCPIKEIADNEPYDVQMICPLK
nr:GNAT family N-acetyltransferase [bacterium]